jgi:hypothetical protein
MRLGRHLEITSSLRLFAISALWRARSLRLPKVLLWLLLATGFFGHGCATAQPNKARFPPYQQRAQSEVRGDLRVSVSVPTAKEAEAIYGVDLTDESVQPVWIEVSNDSTLPYWFLTSGLDPNYFAPSEVAHAFYSKASDDANWTLDARFDSLQFKNPIMPGTTVSGFVLTNLDEGFKVVEVDLIARGDANSFTFITVDPTFQATSMRVDFDDLYGSEGLVFVEDEVELRGLLEQLPCCATNEDGTQYGDPLNLVLIGTRKEIFAALLRRQWHPTEILHAGSLWRTIKSFLKGSRYRYSPMSPLYVFGRPQDVAGQKTRATIHERNHSRYWLTPIRFQGKEVWVGQISRDIGVKYTLKAPTISTHVIDPDVDEARLYLIEDFAYSQALQKVGFVKGVGAASREAPRLNLVGDPYYTDGLRAVMVIGARPHSLSDIERLEWDWPPSSRMGLEDDARSKRDKDNV